MMSKSEFIARSSAGEALLVECFNWVEANWPDGIDDEGLILIEIVEGLMARMEALRN